LIRFPLNEMIQRVGLDNHPPLYFIILKGWASLFGSPVGALRLLSVLFGSLDPEKGRIYFPGWVSAGAQKQPPMGA
jgi:hypothetical protein